MISNISFSSKSLGAEELLGIHEWRHALHSLEKALNVTPVPAYNLLCSDFEVHPRLTLKFPKISKIPNPSVFPHLSFQEGQVSPTRCYRIGSVGDSSATAKTKKPSCQHGKVHPDKKLTAQPGRPPDSLR